MSKTREELRTHARVYLDEVSEADWTDAQIDRELNYAYMEVYTAVVEVYEDYYQDTHTFNLVDGTNEYDLPDDFFKLKRLELKFDSDDDYGYQSKSLDFRQLHRAVNTTDYGSTFRPVHQLIGNILRILPVPSEDVTDGGKLFYITTASEMDSDSDTINIPFPDRYGKYLVKGAVAELLSKGQQEEVVAASYRQDFRAGMEKMQQELKRRYLDSPKMIVDSEGMNIDFEAVGNTKIIYS